MMIYPLTIVLDRYGGVYSGGKYTAWNLEFEEVPGDISDGDNECMSFWGDNEVIVGVGDTPKRAIKNLILKMLKEETPGRLIDQKEIDEIYKGL